MQKNEVKLELRIDAPDGEKIGEFYPRCTSGPARFLDMVTPLEPVRGTRALFIVVRSAVAAPVGTIDLISLEKAEKPIDMAGIGLPPLTRNGTMVLPEPTHRPRAKPGSF